MTERRSLAFRSPAAVATRAGGAAPKIVGYAAVFYRAGDAGTAFPLADDAEERIMPGAFDRAIREDDVRALFNHDPALVLGRNTAGTLRLSADATGLRYEIDPPDTQTARDVLAMLRRGDVSGSSFAFETVRENLRRDGSVFVRELTEVRLYDVGPVTYPAYTASTSGARTTGPRSARADADLIALALAVMSMESGGNPVRAVSFPSTK